MKDMTPLQHVRLPARGLTKRQPVIVSNELLILVRTYLDKSSEFRTQNELASTKIHRILKLYALVL